MPKKIRILLVEDEAITALYLKGELERMGHHVYEPFAAAEAAVAFARDNPCEAVLMDIRLAGRMDGIEAAEIISSFCDAAIIFMSGYSDHNMQTRAQKLHSAAYLVKPVDPDEVGRLIAAFSG